MEGKGVHVDGWDLFSFCVDALAVRGDFFDF